MPIAFTKFPSRPAARRVLASVAICGGAVLLAPQPVQAEDEFVGEFSANVALTSTYVFRGIDQSDAPAIQGGIDYGHPTGFYAGFWGSNVDFGDGDEAILELDAYAGYSNSIGDVSYDVGFIYYAYPSADDDLNYDYWEVYGSLGYEVDAFSISAGLAFSPEYFADSGDFVYVSGSIGYAVNDYISIDGGVGYSSIDDNAAFGTPDYLDWSFGATFSWNILSLDLRYLGTDMDENECFGGSDLCDDRFVATLSASF